MELKSFFAQLFISLQTKILADLPEIKWVDQDLGQLESYEVRPPVLFPCVLIDFDNTTFDQMQQDRQAGNCSFTLRLGFPAFSPAHSAAPESAKEKALQYYEIENRLYALVQGFDADGIMQPATRVSVQTERREEDSLRVRVMTFTTAFEDSTAVDILDQGSRPDLEIETEIVN
jgi:hypothetical protein